MSNVSIIENLSHQDLDSLKECSSLSAALRHLGIHPLDPRARKALKDRMEQEEVEFINGHRYQQYTPEDVRRAVVNSECYTDVLRHVGLAPHGGNIHTIKQLIKQHNIDISHFSASTTRLRNKRVWSQEEIFCKNSSYHRTRLRHAVLKHEAVEYVCESCGNEGEWMGEELPLDLDHVNGDNSDNRIENLRFLCPNCHRQTPTWGRSK